VKSSKRYVSRKVITVRVYKTAVLVSFPAQNALAPIAVDSRNLVLELLAGSKKGQVPAVYSIKLQ
jgi:hypothetical protein